MKLKFLLLTLSICLFSVGQITAQTTNFRNFNWGVSKARVKSEETAKIVLEKARLMHYESVFAGYNATIVYKFTVEHQLMKGQYILKNPLAGSKEYFHEFTFLENLLSEKYGEKTKTLVKF